MIEIDIELRDANDYANHQRLHRIIIYQTWMSKDGKRANYEVLLDGRPAGEIIQHDRASHVMVLTGRAVDLVEKAIDDAQSVN